MPSNKSAERILLRVLRPDEVSRRWDEISGFLDLGSEFGHGDFVIDDIKALVDDGKAFIVALEVDGGRMILASASATRGPFVLGPIID